MYWSFCWKYTLSYLHQLPDTVPPSLMVRLLFWRSFCMYLAISMAQSIIRDRLLFSVHFEWFTENYPFLFEGLQNILKGMWRVGPQNKGNSPSILFHTMMWIVFWPYTRQYVTKTDEAMVIDTHCCIITKSSSPWSYIWDRECHFSSLSAYPPSKGSNSSQSTTCIVLLL